MMRKGNGREKKRIEGRKLENLKHGRGRKEEEKIKL